MERHYFIHRIKHEWEVSYPLFEAGYMSMGWSDYYDTDVLERIEKGGENAFNQFMSENNNRSRSRWVLWYFSQFKKGDYIVVPLFEEQFAVCEVLEKAKSVLSLEGNTFDLGNGLTATVGRDGLTDTNGRKYDIGFVVRIDIKNRIPRRYADADLVSRMKIRQTNGRIDDIAKSVEAAAVADGPINIHEKIMDSVSDSMKETIRRYITPDKLEDAVVWYMIKKGADRAWKPAKNESGKKDGADADVIAEFDDLGLVYYIQAKNHQGVSDYEAVRQIAEYNKQMQDDRDGITFITWAISTADDFSSEAKDMSREYNVRLINGDEFINMILNVGLDGIENAVK